MATVETALGFRESFMLPVYLMEVLGALVAD
jgi:hypothetical protein